jgi:flagellar hook-associated protein 1 FlgK
MEVGYQVGSKVAVLPDGALSGGKLGGLLEFRTETLDAAQSSLGKIAIGMAFEFNAQHELGLDQNGNKGQPFFNVAPAFVGASINNAKGTDANPAAELSAKVTDPSKLKDSDYEVTFKGGKYSVMRLSDNKEVGPVTPGTNGAATFEADGIEFTFDKNPREKDTFLVRPTIDGAANFKVLANDVSQIAAAAPILTSMPLTNTGTAKISEGKVSGQFLTTPPALPVTLSIKGDNLTGFPAGSAVTITDSAGKPVTDSDGKPIPVDDLDNIKFVDGATYSFSGVSVTISGKPGNGDQFKIEGNSSGVGDTRNIAALGELQTKNIFNNGTATLTSSYAQMVSQVGNKTREVQVNAQAGNALLAQATGAQADVSGVNLDEEAANLIKYQQAYQASSKVMQIAGTIFDTLLSISR